MDQNLSASEEELGEFEIAFTGEIKDQRCRICGCTDMLACDGGCGWATEGLCTACVHRLNAHKGLARYLATQLKALVMFIEFDVLAVPSSGCDRCPVVDCLPPGEASGAVDVCVCVPPEACPNRPPTIRLSELAEACSQECRCGGGGPDDGVLSPCLACNLLNRFQGDEKARI